MKLCRFNYFLKENEKITFFTECKLKSITTFDILDTEGLLLASDRRLIFCKLIGYHLICYSHMNTSIYHLVVLKKMTIHTCI